MKKYLCGMVTGVMIGATVAMIVVPQLDRKTQRAMKKYGRRVMDMAEDSIDGIRGMRY